MYTRNKQNQNYGNARNSNKSQIPGPYTVPSYNTQGSYQASQPVLNQQSNYKQGKTIQQNLQGFQSQQQKQQQPPPPPPPPPQQQQQQQTAQMPAPARPIKLQITTQQQLHQGQQQVSQQQQQQQQQPQQSQQQSPIPNPPPLSQRLKPILKQRSTTPPLPIINPVPTISQPSALPLPATAAATSTNNNFEAKDENVKTENTDVEIQEQPRWRRKIPGFKVNKRLKRLRMNQRLRKTLQPKNAIMVLNEMKAGCQFTFPETQGHMSNSLYLVHAELDGKTYVGQGLSKPLARQNAAENALKALLLEKMTAASMKARLDAESDVQDNLTTDGIKEENNDDAPMDVSSLEDEIPWSSLASFALYKLFLEWHNQGTSVPVPRPGLPATKGLKKENASSPRVSTQKELPPNPTSIHPVMLLNQMRPGLSYVEVNRVGNPPNTMFTLAVEIDGVEYTGTAKNKKDAKKSAAKTALLTLYGLTYPEDVKTDNVVVG